MTTDTDRLAGRRNVIVAHHWPDRTVVVVDIGPGRLATPAAEGGWERAWTLRAKGRYRDLPVVDGAALRSMVAVSFWTRDDQEVTRSPDLDHGRARAASFRTGPGTFAGPTPPEDDYPPGPWTSPAAAGYRPRRARRGRVPDPTEEPT